MATTRRTYGPDGLNYVETTDGERTDSIEMAQDVKGLWRVTSVKVYHSGDITPGNVAQRLRELTEAAQAQFKGRLAGEDSKP